MSSLNFTAEDDHIYETKRRLEDLPEHIKELYLSFMNQHQIPIKLTDNTHVLNFKESGSEQYLVKGSHGKIKIMASLIPDFQYNYFILRFQKHFYDYFKYINRTIRFSSGLITVNLFKNYTSFNDVEFFEFVFQSKNMDGNEFKIYAKFYVNDIKPIYLVNTNDDIYITVNYKKFDDLLPLFIQSYKKEFEEYLQQSFDEIDEDIINLIKMINI